MFWKDALVPNPRPGSPLEPPAGLTQQAHTNFRGAYCAGRAGPLVLSQGSAGWRSWHLLAEGPVVVSQGAYR